MVGQRGAAYTLKIRSGCAGGGKGALVQTEKVGTLSTLQDQTLFQLIDEPAYCISGNTVDRATNQNGTGVRENGSFTVNTVDRHAVVYKVPVLNDQGGSMMDVTYDVTGTLRAAEHGHQPIVFDARGNGNGNTVPTITGDYESRITDYTAIAVEQKDNVCAGFSFKAGAKANGVGFEIEKAGTLYAERHDAAVVEKLSRWIVRRLTPTECERLQGYPDGWTDIGEWTDTKGKKHKPADTPRYKALGNSIALPQWFWIAQKMRLYLKDKPTLGSLFDGIGGFPLVWETAYGAGTAVWASEIEEFPIAVTKRWFGNDTENESNSGAVLRG
jgi:DNA (cytosine-5)-methyltransferase 1